MELKFQNFKAFVEDLLRKWIRIILWLGITLVPAFGLLDFVIVPNVEARLAEFWGLRIGATLICCIQLLLLRFTPNSLIIIHAYIFSFTVGGIISYMTTQLGGFESSYYAGLNLVIIGVNVFLPWKAVQGALNGLMIILQYIVLNLIVLILSGGALDISSISLTNNLFFMSATVIIATTIGYHKFSLQKMDFNSRNALWGEMEIAKKIQTALLPSIKAVPGYKIASIMKPAVEVGGDYYDIIELENADSSWVCIGDVAGHGVSAGLIMMMTQTSIQSVIKKEPDILPSQLLIQVNKVLNENISRLGERKYLTISALKLSGKGVEVSGKHQDILVFRKKSKIVESFTTQGFWLGLGTMTNITNAFVNTDIHVEPGDILLLFTDGVTEHSDGIDGPMFGMDRLKESLKRHATAPENSGDIDKILEAIMAELDEISEKSDDDISMVLLEKT